jgi:hypothetical protein
MRAEGSREDEGDEMNRRTFLHAAGGALAVGACGAGAAASPLAALQNTMRSAVQSPLRIAVYDPALAQGRALARAAARRGMPALAAGGDIGALWYAQLARRLDSPDRAPAVAFCALRASDRFVLERLATPRRCIVLNVPTTA